MIQRTRLSTVLALALGSLGVAWLILQSLASRGSYLPPVSWLISIAVIIMAVIVLITGRWVRAYQRGDRPQLDPLWAVRIVSWAKACVIAGAVMWGAYGAQMLMVIGDLHIEAQADRAWRAGAAVVAATVLVIAGLIVEFWCQIPPPQAEAERDSVRDTGVEGSAA